MGCNQRMNARTSVSRPNQSHWNAR
jgi:hypothetical protein